MQPFSVHRLVPLVLIVVLLAVGCDSADEEADTNLIGETTELTTIITTTVATSTTPGMATTTTSSFPPSDRLSISGSSIAVLCNSQLHRIGSVSGAQPGERISFSSPDVSGITPGNADSSGRLDMRWFCKPDDAGASWRITATSESGNSATYTLYGVVSQAATTTTTTGVHDALPVLFSHSQDHSDTTFEAEGAAVDEGAMCSSGTRSDMALQSNNGMWLTDEEWAGMFDSAMAAEIIAEVYVIETWTCDDGSGVFTVTFHNRFDFATFEFEGQQSVGTWEITRGDGDYGDRTGSGNVTLDWDEGRVVYVGTVR
jgi:hypothetical protein